MHETGRNWSEWHGEDEKRRDGKGKNMQGRGGWGGGEGGTMSRKAARASAGEKATTRGEGGLREACVAVLNISITD